VVPGSWTVGLPVELALSLVSGAALGVGWVGAAFLGLPAPLALLFYLVAYVAGGYDASKHAVKAAVKGRFDIGSLMVVAALGAASLGEWPEGALLLFLFSFGHALEHHAMDRARNAIRALGKLGGCVVTPLHDA
jgi:Cd2+/Zn2+-exporting ATPase